MLAAFFVGAVVALIAIGIFVSLTYKCTSGPCDAGGMAGFALWMIGGPIVGALFSYAVHRHIARKEGHRHDA
jgi:hypothetical protein